MIIDSHTHMYPTLEQALAMAGIKMQLGPLGKGLKAPGLLKKALDRPQNKLNRVLQGATPLLRFLPKEALPYADMIHGLVSLGGSLAKSAKQDLLDSMEKNGIDMAFVIAHPPLIPNEFVLEQCSNEPKLKAIVNIPKSEDGPSASERLKEYVREGAIGLKIHAAADGFDSSDPHYAGLLETANELELPVVIHTGCIHIRPVYKDPQMGHAENFEQWFSKYPNINFVLAHMNYHHPEKAIDYCMRHSNVYCDVSWQPSAVIEEALEKIPEKTMFGTDWPLVGSNQETMLERSRHVQASPMKMEGLYSLCAKRVFKV